PDRLQRPPGTADARPQLQPAGPAALAVDQDAPTGLPPLDLREDQAEEFEEGPLLPDGPLAFVEQHRDVVVVPQPRRPRLPLQAVEADGQPFALDDRVEEQGGPLLQQV